MTYRKGFPTGRRRRFGGGEKSGLKNKRRDVHGEGEREMKGGFGEGLASICIKWRIE